MDKEDQVFCVDIAKTVEIASDHYIQIRKIDTGRWYHKLYVKRRVGKVESFDIIKVVNDKVFIFGGQVYLRGKSLVDILANSNNYINK